jgi:hypothetical protein
MANIFLNRIKNEISQFVFKSKTFTFSIAFWNLLYNFRKQIPLIKPIIIAQKHRVIIKYLAHKYSFVIENFLALPENTNTQNTEYPDTIWVCWWDGIETMPDIVKVCYNSLKINFGKCKIEFITKDNFKNFVSISDHVMEKLNSGIMTLTHFSNILRMNLLYKYGGIWIDSTVFVSNTIHPIESPLFTIRRRNKGYYVSESRWTGYCIGGSKHNIFFDFMIQFLYAYWKEENNLIDYFTFDYIIAVAYNYIPQIKKLFDNIPYNNEDVHVIQNNLNREYTEEFTKEIFERTAFHKLSWKNKYDMYTKDNKLTIYGYLIQNYANKE